VPDNEPFGPGEFAALNDAPRGALLKLERYAELLAEWNQLFNLVSEASLPHIWRRHFLDSAQLAKYIPAGAHTADLGSGAGFPGLVLSILGIKHVHLIESIGKKARFLEAVVKELKLDAVVHNVRIESLHDMRFDVITARALKPLPHLLKLAKPLMKKESFCLFLKGKQLDIELTETAKYWRFGRETFSSLSDRSGCVLKISNLEPKPGHPDAVRRKSRHH
jgi:16S rRNA (guanine527-N7)-methyltransferase